MPVHAAPAEIVAALRPAGEGDHALGLVERFARAGATRSRSASPPLPRLPGCGSAADRPRGTGRPPRSPAPRCGSNPPWAGGRGAWPAPFTASRRNSQPLSLAPGTSQTMISALVGPPRGLDALAAAEDGRLAGVGGVGDGTGKRAAILRLEGERLAQVVRAAAQQHLDGVRHALVRVHGADGVASARAAWRTGRRVPCALGSASFPDQASLPLGDTKSVVFIPASVVKSSLSLLSIS